MVEADERCCKQKYRLEQAPQRDVQGMLNKTNFANVPSPNYLVQYHTSRSRCAMETCILYPMSLPFNLSLDACFSLLPERC